MLFAQFYGPKQTQFHSRINLTHKYQMLKVSWTCSLYLNQSEEPISKEPQDNVSISKKTLKYVHVITKLTGMKHHLLISLLQW